ncbi:hypothetical protein BCR43DRAFT_416131, partial [Syncephalastrum racemosum]
CACSQLVLKGSRACHLHSQRTLSVAGRTTIVNSLVLARVWHVLRVTPLTKSTLGSLRSTIRRFLVRGLFPPPPIKYDTLLASKQRGGRGILDPWRQQCTLQLSWLRPLLASHLSSAPRSPLLDALCFTLQAHFQQPNHLPPLLFPAAR